MADAIRKEIILHYGNMVDLQEVVIIINRSKMVDICFKRKETILHYGNMVDLQEVVMIINRSKMVDICFTGS